MSKLTLLLSEILSSNKVERIIRNLRDNYLRNYKNIKLPDEIFRKHLKYHSLSFCTTSMNRLFHLKKTYLKNIEDNIDYPNIEFILLNYNSKDDLHNWARKNLKEHINSGLVKYYATNLPDSFDHSKAKNLAHKLSENDILINLDGDNFTGKNFSFYINHLFNNYGLNIIAQCKKAPFWGVDGRICLTKKNFNKIGGYDEALIAGSHEDADLIKRSIANGLKHHKIEIDNFLHYLSNSQEEKLLNIKHIDKNISEIIEFNKAQSDNNILNNKIVANIKNGWGKSIVFKNFSNEAIIVN